ncbi:MAG: hypothetical protein M1605_01185 [Candidatus Thermoplasmatota archaeon]|nr:hypothetical protein [Candidatus Thermoplasmatota archaeon]
MVMQKNASWKKEISKETVGKSKNVDLLQDVTTNYLIIEKIKRRTRYEPKNFDRNDLYVLSVEYEISMEE